MPDKVVDVKKEEEEKEEQQTKERIEKGYVPWGVTSFADLEAAREAAEAAEKTYDLMSDYTGLVFNVLENSDIEDKPAAIKKITKELEPKLSESTKEANAVTNVANVSEDGIVDKIIKGIKDFFAEDIPEQNDKQNDFMLWKEADGTMRWLATYSNKFRDDDRPPEIISEISHIKFEELVDTKQVSMPELWLWHVPEWKYGVADWIAWDTEGFALASGTIDEGKESVAEWISEQKDVAVSHGMPIDSIVRDPDDPSIIVGHETREISTLPYSAAANKRTDFLIISNNKDTKQEEVMAISSEKKKKLQSNWNAPSSLLEKLEATNSDKAEEALKEGVDFKETEAETTEPVAATETEAAASETETEPEVETEAETKPETEESETQAADGDDVQSEYPTREEVVEAVAPMAKQMAELTETVTTLLEVVKELAETDEEKIAKAASVAPPASIAAMIAKNMSAIGSEETQVKGSEKLAKSKPEEAPPVAITGVEYIDNILMKKQ